MDLARLDRTSSKNNALYNAFDFALKAAYDFKYVPEPKREDD